MNAPNLRIKSRRSGQSTVEYLLVVAVLSIALVVASYAFIGPFDRGFRSMTQDAGTVIKSGTRNGSGDRR
jgi:Flp pilus assembly pilin Flp